MLALEGEVHIRSRGSHRSISNLAAKCWVKFDENRNCYSLKAGISFTV